MNYCQKNIGKPDPKYGGVLTDVSTLPVGTKFFVCNGCWYGEIADMGDGAIGIGLPTPTGEPRFWTISRIDPKDWQRNILALSDIKFPEDHAAERKTVSIGDGKYTIVYDPAGSYPEQCLRYGEPWRDLTGDNLIFVLCAELEKARAADGNTAEVREASKECYQICEGTTTYLLEINHTAKTFSVGSVEGSVKAPGYTPVDMTAYKLQIRRIGAGDYKAVSNNLKPTI